MKFKLKWSTVAYLTVYMSLAIMGVAVLDFYHSKLDSDYIPNLRGYAYFNVAPGGMEPAIASTDLVIGKMVNPKTKIKVGDIVVFKDYLGRDIARRIMEVRDTGYVTKGDANEVRDESLLPFNAILAKVNIKIPFLGFVLGILQNTTGQILLGSLLFIAVCEEIIREYKLFCKENGVKNNVVEAGNEEPCGK